MGPKLFQLPVKIPLLLQSHTPSNAGSRIEARIGSRELENWVPGNICGSSCYGHGLTSNRLKCL